jgi:nitrate/TMAO reductase-like tetraheme cytochrome c subunit
MNKISFLGAAFAVSILSGCVTTGSENKVDLANVNFNELSCEEISQTFKDYKSTVDSGDTMSSLISLASSDASAAANKAKSVAMQVYYQAKKTAAPAIKIKGCNI